ncbi:hypothetical protein [Arthrobacter sp. NPDC090010]|uniref:hypothetical protein n=1 Tax=Arthrobacter sp. NPDC090010 TaxID=3363942 RepID=UPI0037F8FBE5
MRMPTGLSGPGKALWKAVTADFELADHEAAQLAEACHVRDTIEALRAEVKASGTMIPSSQGMRLHPAIAEIRAQQLALARLLATLAVPGLEEDDLPKSRGVRGVYSPNYRGLRSVPNG